MIRRAFFAALSGLPALLSLRNPEAKRLARDGAMADPYIRQPDGRWLRVRHEDVKPGDEMIMFGLDRDELFILKRLSVRPNEGAGFVIYQGKPAVFAAEGSERNLLRE